MEISDCRLENTLLNQVVSLCTLGYMDVMEIMKKMKFTKGIVIGISDILYLMDIMDLMTKMGVRHTADIVHNMGRVIRKSRVSCT